MKFKIDYMKLEGQAKRDKAIKDMRNYLSPYSFNIITTIAMGAIKYQHLSFPASFAGVTGYPIVALWDETREEMRSMCS